MQCSPCLRCTYLNLFVQCSDNEKHHTQMNCTKCTQLFLLYSILIAFFLLIFFFFNYTNSAPLSSCLLLPTRFYVVILSALQTSLCIKMKKTIFAFKVLRYSTSLRWELLAGSEVNKWRSPQAEQGMASRGGQGGPSTVERMNMLGEMQWVLCYTFA